MNNREINVAFAKPELEEKYEKLKDSKTEDKQLYKFITRAIGDLKKNPGCGVKIPKDLWPRKYIREYGINNLWKYDLPNAWRLIYTIVANQVMILNIILEWLSHKDYERRFGY